MQATDILMNEHRVIEQVLDCLDAVVAKTRKTSRLDRTSAEQILDFLREFADHCHHGKEENHLFPWLERHGFSRQMGPTGVMLREHTLGRHHIHQMTAAVNGAAQGVAADVENFCHNAQTYVQLLREHIHKEDHCLFAMAAQVATPQDDAELLSAYAAVEEHDIGAGVHERYLALADELASRLGVQRRLSAALESTGCGCGHGGH